MNVRFYNVLETTFWKFKILLCLPGRISSNFFLLIQSLHFWEHTSRDSKPCCDLQEASSESFRSFYPRRILGESVHVRSSNVHNWSLGAWDSKTSSDIREASSEIFRSFCQRRTLELSMHVRSSNLHIQSSYAYKHTSRDPKPCSDIQVPSPEGFKSFYQRIPLE